MLIVIVLLGFGVIVGSIYVLTTRSQLRRQDFQALRDERDNARIRARVVTKFLTRTRGQVELILRSMPADRLELVRNDRIMLEALRDQLAQLDDNDEGTNDA